MKKIFNTFLFMAFSLCLFAGEIRGSSFTEISSSTDDFVIEEGVLTSYKGTIAKPAEGKSLLILPKDLGIKSIKSEAFASSAPDFLVVDDKVKVSDIANFDKLNIEIIPPIELEVETLVEVPQNPEDYEIENGVLIKYWGWDSDLEEEFFEENENYDPSTVEFKIVMPAGMGVTTIGENAFNDARVKCVVLPEGVETIGNFAFHSADTLEIVILPSTVKTIENNAFAHGECNVLRYVNLPDSIESIGINAFTFLKTPIRKLPANLKKIESGAFKGANFVTDVLEFPAGVKSIGNKAFTDIETFKEIIFPEGLETIGNSSFYGCTNLKKVTFPSTIKSIGMDAFYFTKLKSVKIPASCKYDGAFDGSSTRIIKY